MTSLEMAPCRTFGRAVLIGWAIGASIGGAVGAVCGLAAGPAAGLLCLFIGIGLGTIPGTVLGLANGAILLLVDLGPPRPRGVIAVITGVTSFFGGAGLVGLAGLPVFDSDHLGGALFAIACGVIGALAGPFAAKGRVR